MIIQNTYNRKCQEYVKFDDLLEDQIKPLNRNFCTISNCDHVNPLTGKKCQQGKNKKYTRLNATGLEQYLARVNVGSKRRLKNNHAERLAAYKLRAK